MALYPGRASFEPSSVLEATVNLMAASGLLQKAWLVMFFWTWVPQAVSCCVQIAGERVLLSVHGMEAVGRPAAVLALQAAGCRQYSG